ncbi:MAG: hypothetical protein FWD35_05315 [Oscillospiraceae bacterium]|nr:hypothetical protein [Oscillospiraceae bacterium]
MKHIFVINPHSFRAFGGTGNFRAQVRDCFSGHNADEYLIHISRYPRDAIGVVHNYIQSCPKDETVRVYAVGGDGILFECLNGMVGFQNAELTCVPYGNANDFTLAFGEEAAAKFRDIKSLSVAPSRPMDIIHCGSNYVMLGLTIGLVGKTVIIANDIFPKLPPKWLRKHTKLAYSLCAVRAMFSKKIMEQKYRLTIDGQSSANQYCNIFILNTALKGGGILPVPYANPNDGNLDVLFIKNPRGLERIKVLIDNNKGHFEKRENHFDYKLCKTMKIVSDELLNVEMDGEAFYAAEITLKIIPDGIKIFVPVGLDFVDFSHRAYRAKNRVKKGGVTG